MRYLLLLFAIGCNGGWYAWPAPSAAAVHSLWGQSKNDIWAVGDAGTITHWDGTAWSTATSGSTDNLLGVWSTGPSEAGGIEFGPSAWAIGSADLLHWQAGTWSPVDLSPGIAMAAIWGSAADAIWIVGDSGIIQWDGTSWSLPTSSPHPLRAVWGTTAKDVWAVGAAGTSLHWNGTSWLGVDTAVTIDLNSVWGSGSSDVWAVGQAGIIHWDGTSWSAKSISWSQNADGQPQVDELAAIWGSGSKDVWAVGKTIGSLAHWDGSHWSVDTTSPLDGGSVTTLSAVWGSSKADVWAAGSLLLHH